MDLLEVHRFRHHLEVLEVLHPLTSHEGNIQRNLKTRRVQETILDQEALHLVYWMIRITTRHRCFPINECLFLSHIVDSRVKHPLDFRSSLNKQDLVLCLSFQPFCLLIEVKTGTSPAQIPIRTSQNTGPMEITGDPTALDRIKTTAVKVLRGDLETLKERMNQNRLNMRRIKGLMRDEGKEKMMYSGTETVVETGTEREILKEIEILIDQEQESQIETGRKTEMETKT